MEDTIVAIATPLGTGGVAMLRMSGKAAISIADEIFRGKKGTPSEYVTHTCHYGVIHEQEPMVDEVVLTVMRAPHSYTTEDVVEITCHGGMVSAKRILDLCVRNGARLATAGEFTKRAFLNGRIDLTQAEAVMDIVTAQTEGAHEAAVAQLEGHLYRRLEKVYHHLYDILASVEAHIDFPEEDIAPETRDSLLGHIKDAIGFQQNLIRTARDGRVLREGVRTIVIGKPNVGKSTLLNCLLGYERAIVHETPGTTRDVIEELVSIEDLPIRLMDTAGLRDDPGEVEKEGIARTRQHFERAELVLLILDGSKPMEKIDRELLEMAKQKPCIIVVNKKDLPQKIEANLLQDFTTCSLSAQSGYGVQGLKKWIAQHLWQGKTRESFREVFVNARHQEALMRSCKALEKTQAALKEKKSFEYVAADLREALEALGEVTGRNVTEDVLDRIFSKFCIGK